MTSYEKKRPPFTLFHVSALSSQAIHPCFAKDKYLPFPMNIISLNPPLFLFSPGSVENNLTCLPTQNPRPSNPKLVFNNINMFNHDFGFHSLLFILFSSRLTHFYRSALGVRARCPSALFANFMGLSIRVVSCVKGLGLGLGLRLWVWV